MTRTEKLEFIDKWIAALRSGKYEQGTGLLRNGDSQFCCLGVGCDLLGAKWVLVNGCNVYQPSGIVRSAGDIRNIDVYHDLGFLNDESARGLANMNDNGKSFSEIASYIEAHKEELAGGEDA